MIPARLRGLLTQPAVVSSALVTALLFGIQQLGALEAMELKAFDQMMQKRTDPGPDPRILVVEVNEKDLQKLNQWPLSGQVLDNLFSKLERYQPRVIGLDIFRDLPVEPGHAKLIQHLQQSDRIVPVCKHGDSTHPPVAPPPGIEPNRVGFSDIVEDTDGIIRRNLLRVSPDPTSPCATPYSFGFQLALDYLVEEGIQPKLTSKGNLQLGNTVFKRLQRDSGGYQQVDVQGYQLLLNYRSPHHVAKYVSVTEVLSDRVAPGLVRDRVVLIGSTAPSLRDVFNTPYSAGQQDNSGKMAGVIVHAQMVSQILSTVLDRRPLFWFWPEWGEVLWIWAWSLVGGVLAWRIQHPLSLGLAGGAALAALWGGYFVIFTQAGWVPLVAPVLGLAIAAGSVVAYTAHQTKQQQKELVRQAQEREKYISQLQAFLREEGGTSSDNGSVVNKLRLDTLLKKRYRITGSLRFGEFSHTYLAQDTQRPGDPQCVVKHLQPARNDAQFLEVARRLFKTEAEVLERLGQHEQIPQLLAYFEEQQQFYLVEELIQGHPLSDELASGKHLLEAQVVDLLKDVLQVLVFVHNHHVIHRDIKPSNLIRRERDNHIVLIDFGAVKQIQPQQMQEESHTVAVGTPGYAPLEQFLGEPRLNSDIYALGMTAIQALTGTPVQQLQRDPNTSAVVWRHSAEIREELAAVLDKMVYYDFRERYQSAVEVLKSLEDI
jgi:CHASE2 domain-containing sensor protein/tRNA A-37 threonylcarbamoyl transferase component Bud32